MIHAPRIEPISTLVRDASGFLAGLNGGPVHLTQRGHEAAVILSAVEWRKLVEYVENLEAVVRLHNAEKLDNIDRFSPDDLDAWVKP